MIFFRANDFAAQFELKLWIEISLPREKILEKSYYTTRANPVETSKPRKHFYTASHIWLGPYSETWSQSYVFELQHQRCINL
jgi:hypothetical protein